MLWLEKELIKKIEMYNYIIIIIQKSLCDFFRKHLSQNSVRSSFYYNSHSKK